MSLPQFVETDTEKPKVVQVIPEPPSASQPTGPVSLDALKAKFNKKK